MRLRARLLVVAVTLLPIVVLAVPGDRIDSVDVAVPVALGIGVAVDCQDPATMYYTVSYDPTLYMMTTAGVGLGSVPLTDAAGAPVSFGAITWDRSRQMLWGGTDRLDYMPVDVYLIDQVTGSCTYKFTLTRVGPAAGGFCDGIAMDRDQTIWVSDDSDTLMEHWDVSGVPTFIGAIVPRDAAGDTLGTISGMAVGKGDRMYLGRNGLSKITAVTKSTGAFISEFATTYDRVEGLACDLVTFAPLEVIWAKDAWGGFVEAFEVEAGTCECAGGGEEIPTLTEWGMIIFCVLLFGWMAWVIVRRRKAVNVRI